MTAAVRNLAIHGFEAYTLKMSVCNTKQQTSQGVNEMKGKEQVEKVQAAGSTSS